MAETTNDDLRMMIQESITANRAMHEATALRMGIDARANADQLASLKSDLGGKVEAVTRGLTTLEQRIVTVEKTAEGADVTAKAAVKSHDALQSYVRDEFKDVKEILAGQNEASVKAAQVAKDEAEERERKRQSIAAARLHTEKMTAARTPQIVALLGTLGVIGAGLTSYYTTRAAHSDLSAKADTQTTQLASVQKKLEVVAQAVASAEPAISAPPVATSAAAAAAPPAVFVQPRAAVPTAAAPAAAPRAVGR